MLAQTTPHYVRCIKPTETQLPGNFDAGTVLHQLRCGGTPQLLELMGKGFPTRTEYEGLCERYRPLLPSLGGASLSAKSFVQALLAALDLKEIGTSALPSATDATGAHAPREAAFALGVRRVFFNAGGMAALDKLMHGSDADMGALVHKVSAYVSRRRWRNTLSLVRTCNRLQRRIVARRALGALAFRARGIVRAAQGVRAWAERARTTVRRTHAAHRIGAVARGGSARRLFLAQRHAVVRIQTTARVRMAMAALVKARAEAEATTGVRAVSARCVQRYARGKLARVQCAALHAEVAAKAAAEAKVAAEAAKVAAEAAKRTAAQQLRQSTQSAVAVQSLVRGRAGRALAAERRAARAAAAAEKEARVLEMRKARSAKGEARAANAAAVRLQTAARAASARHQLAALRTAKAKSREAAQAKRLEQRLRVKKVAAATQLETHVRAFLARSLVRSMRMSASEKQSALLKKREAAARAAADRLRRSASAIKLQGAWRRVTASREVSRRFAEREATRQVREATLAKRAIVLAAACDATRASVHAAGASVLSGDTARYAPPLPFPCFLPTKVLARYCASSSLPSLSHPPPTLSCSRHAALMIWQVRCGGASAGAVARRPGLQG